MATPRKATPRIDEYTAFRRVITLDGKLVNGPLHLTRAVGDLGYAPAVFAVTDDGKTFIPLTAIARMEVA
jgi:hypothetical protein